MEYPILKPTSQGTYRLYESYEIKGILIPRGFETDGLTLKVKLFRLVVDKYQPKFSPFFVLHDYFCSKHNFITADRIGSEVLFEIENSWRTRAMMKLIKLYHKLKYGVK